MTFSVSLPVRWLRPGLHAPLPIVLAALCVLVAAAPRVAAQADAQTFGLGQDAPSRPADLLGRLTLPRAAETRRTSSSNPDRSKNGDARSIEPGATLVLAELDGPGAITHIWCTLASRDPHAARSLVLRMYWDGSEAPSVEVPLGDFFGVGHAAGADFSSLPVSVSSHGRSRSCYWRMPFARGAKITLSNDSAEHRTDSFYYYIDWERTAPPAEPVLYFHARYRQEFPAGAGDYLILETTGRGHYVGTVYSAQMTKTGWFGEGDDWFTIDGASEPQLRGTGTEDYFNDAWGFRQSAAPFSGVSLWEGYFPGDRATAYRWHILDPVGFEKSLSVSIEHRGSLFSDAGLQTASFVERPDWLSSAAFWYQAPAVGPAEPLPPAEKRVAPYRVLRPGELTVRAKPPLVLKKSPEGITYLPGKADAELELDFELDQPGRYQLSAWLVHGIIGSRYQPYLDGQPLGGELDFCRDGFDPLLVRFDLHDLEAGTHTLRLAGRGASLQARTKAPRFYGLGVQSLLLLRLEDLAGYRDAAGK